MVAVAAAERAARDQGSLVVGQNDPCELPAEQPRRKEIPSMNEPAEPNWAQDLRASGDLLDPEADPLVAEPVALWTFVPEFPQPDSLSWRVTNKGLTPAAPPKACARTGVVIIAGIGSTFDDGQRELHARDFSCLSSLIRYRSPAVLVASPAAEQPVFLTARAIVQPTDVLLRFSAWNQGAQPTRVSFRWHLTVAAFEQIQ
jgi:hypothetical protein